MLQGSWAKAVHTWESWQVELHGKYSVERLHNLKRYSLRTSLTHAACDLRHAAAVPAQRHSRRSDPARGAHEGAQVQPHVLVPSVPDHVAHQYHRDGTVSPFHPRDAHVHQTERRGGTYCISWCDGNRIWVGVCDWVPAAVHDHPRVAWVLRVRENPAIQSDLLNYVLVVVAQVALIYVYPVYNFVFIGLTAAPQTAFAMLLPIMKTIAKNCLGYCFRNMDDFKPEMVIFNVEIFHALFVAYCTQRSTSINTTIVLMASDFVHACLGLHDADVMLKSLHKLLRNDSSDGNPALSNTQPVTTQQVAIIPVSSVYRDMNLLDSAMYLLSIDKQFQTSPLLRYHSQVRSPSQWAVLPEQKQVASLETSASSKVVDKDIKPAATVSQSQRGSWMGKNSKTMEDQDRPPTQRFPNASKTNLSDAQKQMLQMMSPENRLLFVHQTLQLLHFTEFLLLIEFTEVIIPAIYCIYLGTISHLSNRQFYVSLRDLDEVLLRNNIANVMVYASLEVVSFLLLSVLLYRKLRVSPLKQLAFVLETQWQLVQSKLILWVVFTVQTSLDHFGVDYSFKFAWLH